MTGGCWFHQTYIFIIPEIIIPIMGTENRLLTFTFGTRPIQACLSIPNTSPQYGVILTHGASGTMDVGELPPLAQHLVSQGLLCLRFTCVGSYLIYRVRMYQKVLEELQSMAEFQLKGVFLGGRSMGSRVAVAVANNSQGTPLQSFIKGVICLSYPLIGSGKGDGREGPLLELQHPTLFISGDKDPMCPKKFMLEFLSQPNNTNNNCVHWIPGAGHGFSGKSEIGKERIGTICHQVETWCKHLCESDKMEALKSAEACAEGELSPLANGDRDGDGEQTSSKESGEDGEASKSVEPERNGETGETNDPDAKPKVSSKSKTKRKASGKSSAKPKKSSKFSPNISSDVSNRGLGTRAKVYYMSR